MSRKPFEMIWRAGVQPESRGYPGHGYRVETDGELLIERDVAVTMRDGVEISVDLYRPQNHTDLAVLIGWGPYGKHGGPGYEFWPRHGIDLNRLSRHAVFENADPAYWCPRGYAIVVPDPRGTWGSQGDAEYLGPQETQDCCDVIEWAGTQPWSNGKVGMIGVSWLANIQWRVAAAQPAHLAAINPWEGMSDLYREVFFHGGIPETQFVPNLYQVLQCSRTRVEDLVAMCEAHPLLDAYWESKQIDFSRIEVPAFVVASWSDQGLHTRGTLEAFRRLASKHKWLEVHGRKKWAYFYEPASVERQRAFFDHFLKAKDTEIRSWPPVQIEVRDRYDEGTIRRENEWPLARTQYRKLFLDAHDGSLRATPVDAMAGTASYDAGGHGNDHRATFDWRFTEPTELTGSMKLRLWVEAQGADDMDLFVAVQKLDAAGNLVPFAFFTALEDGPVALGWLRVSHREVDEQRATPERPWLTHRRELRLKPGEIVPVDIEIWPSSTRFAARERLRLVVQGSDIYQYGEHVFANRHGNTRNAGRHVIHTGGRCGSHLLVPIIPNASR